VKWWSCQRAEERTCCEMMSKKRNSTFCFDENNIMKYFKTRLLHEETETIWNDEYEEKFNCIQEFMSQHINCVLHVLLYVCPLFLTPFNRYNLILFPSLPSQ